MHFENDCIRFHPKIQPKQATIKKHIFRPFELLYVEKIFVDLHSLNNLNKIPLS